MRVLKTIFILVLFTTQVSAETNHWEVIKNFMKETSPQGSKQYEKFLESLSPDELIIAAKQGAEEMESSIAPKDWDVAIGNLGFLFEYYPLKTNNLTRISPLLSDLKDKSQSMFWRRAIMQLLGSSWSDMLSIEQRLDAAKIMHEIYKDNSENLLVKPKAIRKSTDLLIGAYSITLRSDPNVKQFTKQQKVRTPELVDAIQLDRVKLSQQTIKVNEKVLAEINKSIATQLNLFSNKQVDADLEKNIIVAWARYHKYKLDPPQVSQTIANAVDNYKDYNEKLWHILIKTNIEDFGVQSASNKLQDMINAAKDKTLKNRLIRLNKKVQKGK